VFGYGHGYLAITKQMCLNVSKMQIQQFKLIVRAVLVFRITIEERQKSGEMVERLYSWV